GIALIAGAVTFVIRDVLASRAFSTLRFVTIAVLAQFGGLVGLLVFSTVLDGVEAIRYLMPSVLSILGIAVVVAIRVLTETGWWRRIAVGWLVAVPIAAAVAALDVRPPHPRTYVWPDAGELSAISTELVH